MARMAKNNDAMVDAINRMAEAQEQANKLLSKSIDLHEKSYELNSKQYTLNIDNHTFNLKQIEVEKEHSEAVQKAMEDAKNYIDAHVLAVQNVLETHKRSLININTELDKKADQEQVAQSIAKRMMKSIKGKGTI